MDDAVLLTYRSQKSITNVVMILKSYSARTAFCHNTYAGAGKSPRKRVLRGQLTDTMKRKEDYQSAYHILCSPWLHPENFSAFKFKQLDIASEPSLIPIPDFVLSVA